MTPIRLGTRGSRLALAQGQIAAEALAALGRRVEVVPISTRGDHLSARHAHDGWMEGDGQFTRDIEDALVRGEIDVAVHSLKDLPTDTTLPIAATLARADARDCLVTRSGAGLLDLPERARVGTGSTRRAAQLLAARPDLEVLPLRGNVETRLRRLDEMDAVVLAAAGLDRLGLDVPGASRLAFDVMLPAPGQGAIALQARPGEPSLTDALRDLEDRPTRIAVDAERVLLRRIGGGCLAPLGALAEVHGSTLRLRAAYGLVRGTLTRANLVGATDQVESLVQEAVASLTAGVVAA